MSAISKNITKISNPITWKELVTVLDYNSETGIFTWKETRGSLARCGNIAGSLENTGYISIRLGYKSYLAHRLAWFYCFQEWPDYYIDHIDRDKTNNSLDNLRDVPQTINGRNRAINKNNSSGFIGVYKKRNKWAAEIIINGVKHRLGVHDTPVKASAAYKKFEKEHAHAGTSIG